jgi:hypothetical protein
MAGQANRAFCLARGPVPSGASLANGGTILGVQDDRNVDTDFSVDPNNKWWGGPNETGAVEVRLFIAHPVPFDGNTSNPNTQPVPAGVTPTPDGPEGGVGFWGAPTAVDPNNSTDYINIGNNAWKVVNGTPGVFTTDSQVRTWVKSQGYWDNYTGPANNTNPQVPAVQP